MIDRSQPPIPSGSRVELEFPEFDHRQPAPGIEIYVVRWGSAPLISLELLLPGGGECSPIERPGLASLTAALLDEGSKERTGTEIARAIEQLGGSLASGADWESTSVSSISLSRDLDTALRLVLEVALEPDFPAAALERERARRRAELRRRSDRPGYVADRTLRSEIYGGTVYGNPLIGVDATLADVDRAEVESFYEENVVGPLRLIVAGDVNPADVDRITTTVTAGARPRQPLPARVPPVVQPSADHRRVLVVDRPGAQQTELRIGHVGIPRVHPDRPALAVMSSLLGGKFTSRINLNLRERHGFTYGARASFSNRRGPGPFTVSAAVGTEDAGAAAREVFAELARIRDEPATAEELRDTVGYLEGVFPYTLQRAEGVASRLAQIAIHDLPHDHYRALPARLRAVTLEDVQRVARESLNPDLATLVAVGPAETLRPQLEPFGPVEVRSTAP